MDRPLFTPPPPSADVATRVDVWAENKVPPNTRDSYTRLRRRYEEEYCPQHQADCYPASGQQLADWVAWLIQTGTVEAPGRPNAAYAPASLDQAIWAVVRAHHDQGWDAPDPAKARAVVDGYTRWWIAQGGEVRRVDPLTIEQLGRAVGALDLSTPRGLRDRALLLAGFFTMRRASTIAAWDIADVRERISGSRRSLVMMVRASKTDQLGHRSDYAVLQHGWASAWLDPVDALEEWLGWLRRQDEIAQQAAAAPRRGKTPPRVTSGPLLRQLSTNGKGLAINPRAKTVEAMRGRLTTRAVRLIVDNALGPAGIPAQGDYTCHSLRAGGASFFRNVLGWSDEQICSQGGWSPTSNEWRGYLRDINRFNDGA